MLLTELPALYFLPFAVKSLSEPDVFPLTGFISPRFRCATNITLSVSARGARQTAPGTVPESGDSEGTGNPASFTFTFKDSKALQQL